MSDTTTTNTQKAYVVFTGKTEIRWLRFLKKGFRHCFVLLNDGHHWVSIDPLSSYTDVLVHHVPADFDFPDWMEKRGYRVLNAPITRTMDIAPLGIFNCVEAVKRILGLHRRSIITPFQLYKFLHKGEQQWAA